MAFSSWEGLKFLTPPSYNKKQNKKSSFCCVN